MIQLRGKKELKNCLLDSYEPNMYWLATSDLDVFFKKKIKNRLYKFQR
jgi:hypothetical protein